MRYGTDVKRTALEKLMRPGGPKVSELSIELGINETTLYGWVRKARNGGMNGNETRREKMNSREKLAAVLEAGKLGEAELGHWLREKGFQEDQLKQWTREIDTALGSAAGQSVREAELERELKAANKELHRKDKALAEMTALVVLKKKLAAILGEEDPPT
jgi:transposase-like protein